MLQPVEQELIVLATDDSLLSPAVPQVVKSCAEFIEKHGVVDGIYRLSGISSNIQKLRFVPILIIKLIEDLTPNSALYRMVCCLTSAGL